MLRALGRSIDGVPRGESQILPETLGGEGGTSPNLKRPKTNLLNAASLLNLSFPNVKSRNTGGTANSGRREKSALQSLGVKANRLVGGGKA